MDSVERMDQQRDQLSGQVPPGVGPGHTLSRLQVFPLLKVPGGPASSFPWVQGSSSPSLEFTSPYSLWVSLWLEDLFGF